MTTNPSNSNGPSQLTYLLATIDDAESLASLISLAFRSEPTGQTWLFDSQEQRIEVATPELVSQMIADPNVSMLIGHLPSTPQEPVTTCYLRRPAPDPALEPHRTPGAAWLGFLCVVPAYHGNGYGKAQLDYAEQHVRDEWKVDALEIDYVGSRLQLAGWYERCGYVATGKKRPFPYGEKGRQILAEGLEMLVLRKRLEAS
ncbi:hypothetical protein LTR62_003306 [Meristemomyces frigidus]|uniref:N-acetyltransferase domain-containing protein n=1 Tax=Meristemomyces frigidus TaxID=1508187 RepID=A0AAN7TK31_9PEZI|nr:hypothetical protein LTR62_003306 [Meristemomyces frigidus]